MQALSGSTSPQSLVPASQRLPSGLRYDSVSGYAKAAAVTGGKQLLGLGEAGYKYMSSQYGQWRSGSWEGASTRYCYSSMDPPEDPSFLALCQDQPIRGHQQLHHTQVRMHSHTQSRGTYHPHHPACSCSSLSNTALRLSPEEKQYNM